MILIISLRAIWILLFTVLAFTISSSWAAYESMFTHALQQLKDEFHIKSMVFGDIDLDAHREWEEKVCRTAGLTAQLPLWKQDRKTLVLEMLAAGIRSMIVSCNTTLGDSFLGRILDEQLIPELEARDIDVCGEGGEFHTVVLDCPLFRQPLEVPAFRKVQHENYHFLQFN